MSHFLERLAASVVGRPAGPRLRPLSGSIYSPAPLAALPDEPWERSAELSADALGEGTVQSKPISRTAQFKHHTQPDAFAESQASASPRMAQSQHIDPSPQSSVPSSTERAMRPVDARARDDAASGSAERGDSEGQHGSFPRAQGQSEQLLPLRAQEAVVWPATGTTRWNHSEPLRQMQKPAREPDEITIHIGRIEVAAVTQSPVQPAPAPRVRKAMTLDEYLRRGNGRAR